MTDIGKVYTSENSLNVNHCRGLLESEGIACEVRNQVMAGAVGGIPVNEVWPEVWVAESDYDRSRKIVHRMTAPVELVGPAWTCNDCGEELAVQFTQCWNCGAEKRA